MYFFIAGITTKILIWVFVAVFTHFAFMGAMSLIDGKTFELPFYLKPFYPVFVKLLNSMDYYNNFKEGELITYLYFAISLFIFAFIASILNLIIFPIISGVIFTYVFISFKMKFSSSKSDEKKTVDVETTTED